MAGNWVKVYDKVSVLRVETTINNPREFRIQRWVTDSSGRRQRRWCPMRKGVSDLWRTYQVGIAANHRYLDALAAAPLKGEGVAALDALCRPRTHRGRRYARFTPLNTADLALFRAALAGEHAIQASATLTSPAGSTHDGPWIATTPDDDANASPGSSSNSAATASSPRFPAPADTASPATANAS